jgi:single-strand DNA-binding protein
MMPSGQQVASFGIATNRFYTDAQGQKKQDVEFHNIVCFGKLADIASRYLNKGSLILIEGRIKTRNWQDTAGMKHYKTEVIAEALQLGPKGTGGGGGGGGGGNASVSGQYNKSFSQQEPSITKEDIPIIEENAPPSNFVSAEEPKTGEDEINIKDIPF